MNMRQFLIKQGLFFTANLYYLGGYFIINLFTHTRTHHFHLALPFESSIPFYPIFIFAYCALFLMLAYTYIVINDLNYFWKAFKTFILCVTIHFIFFFLMPVEYTLRPVIDPEQSIIYRIVDFFYWLDLPYNCFPSLHISNAFLCAHLLERYRAGYGKVFFPLAILIAISVVLVKQHYIADVLVGMVVAYGTYFYIWRREIIS